MKSYYDFSGKVYLVTGATSGIGSAVVKSLISFGANVAVTGRDSKKVRKIANDLGEYCCFSEVCDLSSEEEIKSFLGSMPKVDGIVYSAGIMKLIPLKFVKASEIDQILNINLKAPILLLSELLRLKKINSSGSIVLLSSINGSVVGSLANSVYGASKGGIHSFVKSAALELGKSGIRINAIAPGMIETEGVSNISDHVSVESILEDIKKYPLGRYGKPSEVAEAALYLLSDASRWVTGTTLVIDGGFTAQ